MVGLTNIGSPVDVPGVSLSTELTAPEAENSISSVPAVNVIPVPALKFIVSVVLACPVLAPVMTKLTSLAFCVVVTE